MQRSFFILAGAAAVAGCGGEVAQSLPGAHTRSLRVLQPAITGGDGTGASPTPNPVDPGSGLKIIGRTRAHWNGAEIDMTNGYGDGSTLALPFDQAKFAAALLRCSAAEASAAAAATTFLAAMWATFGARLAAAMGGAAFTELTVFEAIGVALGTISASEIILAGIATIGTILDLYVAYVCIAGTTSSP